MSADRLFLMTSFLRFPVLDKVLFSAAVVSLFFLGGCQQTGRPLVTPEPAPAAIAGGSAVAINVDARTPGPVISPDFSGVSCETAELLPRKDGRRLFSPNNRALLTMFRTLGIRSLRIGGNTADNPIFAVPGPADIDELFAFARAADVKVIYTLRLRQGDPAEAATVAKYVMDHYGSQVVSLAIGNEPNVYAKTYPEYRELLNRYIAAVTAPGVAPAAVFCGPSTTPSKAEWARDLANDFHGDGKIRLITQHAYPGNSGRRITDVVAGRSLMLSTQWVSGYQKFYDSFAPTAAANHLPYRIEETNNFFHGGAKDVSDTFASALWALDYMHWWAAHDAAGLNFHTGDNVAAGDDSTPCRYALYWTSPLGYNVHPIGYAVKAFAIGGHGRRLETKVAPEKPLNVTAYATLADNGDVVVTVVNKEHGQDAVAANLTIAAAEKFRRAKTMFLTAPNHDIALKEGVLLGGATIGDDGSWAGTWTPVAAPTADGFHLALPPSTAAVVTLSK
jgi:hypothetical protein